MHPIYTYTPDMARPNCPVCGCPVPEPLPSTSSLEPPASISIPDPNPSAPWVGTCAHGHTHTFQLAANPEPPTSRLLTKKQQQQLLANGQRTGAGEAIDPRPVVKLFTPDAGGTWLLTEMDPEEPDRLFGLCDLGLGEPELGYVSLTELETVRGPLGLPVERDRFFEAKHPLSWYAEQAAQRGYIQT